MIFLDASAMIAILADEPANDLLLETIERSPGPIFVSPTSVFETVAGLARLKTVARHGHDAPTPRALFDEVEGIVRDMLADFEAIELIMDAETTRAALKAAREFGKASGHPAQLNFGDCFAYACASTNGLRLLFKGDDFGKTDIAAA